MSGHRGPDSEDAAAFSAIGPLRDATAELSWLLGRGYPLPAALKLVGDHHQLTDRRRKAVARCACSDAALADRQQRVLTPDALRGRRVVIDTFNTVITTERLLAGGPVLRGRDGALRDLAGVHGTWRQVEETVPALLRIATLLGGCEVRWVLDAPISNSGRLAALLRSMAGEARIDVVAQADNAVLADGGIAATSDAGILDRCGAWISLPAWVAEGLPAAWVVDLG